MKQKTIDVHLPSKAVVRVKRMTAESMSEVRDLAKRLARGQKGAHAQYQHLIDKQVAEVLEFGPYDPLKEDAKVRKKWPWRMGDDKAVCPDDWLEGDVNGLATAIYVVRHGSENFGFRHCCPGCQKMLYVEVDVAARLERGETGGVRSYSQEFLDAYKTRAEHPVEFDASFIDADGDSIAFRWRPLLGAAMVQQQAAFMDAENGQFQEIRAVAFKLVEFDGFEDRNAIVRRLKAGDESDLVAIVDQFAEHEGGIENVVEIDCNACGLRSEALLPFEELLVRDVVARKRSQNGQKKHRR